MIKKSRLAFAFAIILLFFDSGNSKAVTDEDRARADEKYNRALLLMNTDPILALSELKAANKLSPKDPKIMVPIGQIYFTHKNHQEAIKAFKKAIKLDENYVVAYSNLGYTYMSLKKWDEAITNFRIILKYPNITAPHYVYNAIGWAYYEKNEFEKSVQELKKSIQHKNSYAFAHYNLGLSLLALERFDLAQSEFKKAVLFQPELVLPHNQLALIFLKKNLKKKAREKFEKVIALAPNSILAEEANNYLNILSGK